MLPSQPLVVKDPEAALTPMDRFWIDVAMVRGAVLGKIRAKNWPVPKRLVPLYDKAGHKCELYLVD